MLKILVFLMITYLDKLVENNFLNCKFKRHFGLAVFLPLLYEVVNKPEDFMDLQSC